MPVQDHGLLHRQTSPVVQLVAGSQQDLAGQFHPTFNVLWIVIINGFLLSLFLLWCPNRFHSLVAPGKSSVMERDLLAARLALIRKTILPLTMM